MKPITKRPKETIPAPKAPKMNLLDFMAQACHYAQSHCGCPEAWNPQDVDREQLLQCTSFQMACFIAQNTVEGHNGVEWDVIIDDLTATTHDKQGMMTKSIDQWKVILQGLIDEYGGWGKSNFYLT